MKDQNIVERNKIIELIKINEKFGNFIQADIFKRQLQAYDSKHLSILEPGKILNLLSWQ